MTSSTSPPLAPPAAVPAAAAPHGLPGPGILLALVAAGGLLAVQVLINGRLSVAVGDAYSAAAVVWVIGLVLLLAAAVTRAGSRRNLADLLARLRSGTIPRWMVLGGLFGAMTPLTQSLVGAVLGTALFSIAFVAGQVVGGLALDRIGLGPSGRHALTARRVLGSLLALAAVAGSAVGSLSGGFPVAALLLPLLAGTLSAPQHALTGRVRAATGSVLTAAVANFAGGAVVTVAITVIHAAVSGARPEWTGDWWLYAGGVTSVFFIAATAVLVARTGVLVLGVGITAGQLLCALVLDLTVGWGQGVTVTTVVCIAVALVAVLVVAVPSRAARRSR